MIGEKDRKFNAMIRIMAPQRVFCVTQGGIFLDEISQPSAFRLF
jgi:hypothetical protein